MEYDPGDYKQLLEPIKSGKANVVYGSRFKGKTTRVLFFWHYIGNKFLTLLSNMLTNLKLTDMETCYKVFKGDIARSIELESNRFGIEPKMTAKISKISDILFMKFRCILKFNLLRYHDSSFKNKPSL